MDLEPEYRDTRLRGASAWANSGSFGLQLWIHLLSFGWMAGELPLGPQRPLGGPMGHPWAPLGPVESPKLADPLKGSRGGRGEHSKNFIKKSHH